MCFNVTRAVFIIRQVLPNIWDLIGGNDCVIISNSMYKLYNYNFLNKRNVISGFFCTTHTILTRIYSITGNSAVTFLYHNNGGHWPLSTVQTNISLTL